MYRPSQHRPSQYSATRRLIRRIGFDRNPLRRRSDRVQAVLRLIAILATLVALPAAIAIGVRVAGVETREARQQTGTRHLVTAVTTTDASQNTSYYSGSKATASARWTYGGVTHSATVAVDQGTNTGTELAMWVDAAGEPTTPPLSVYQAVGDGIFATLGLASGFGLMLIALSMMVAVWLNRARDAAWESEWARIEPGWAGRRHS